jgi:pyruvate,water dikinase
LITTGGHEPPMVRPLADVGAEDYAFAGELGVRLAADRRDGLDDAAGFVIGTPAFAALCDGGLLRRRLAVTLADVCVGDCERLMAAASMARSLVTCEPLPSAFIAQLEQAHGRLVHDASDAAVTVSASAAEPHLPPLALGPCERFRHVRGVGSVAQAVRHCWSALFDARRVYARAQRGLSQTDVEIAVVVVLEGE